jgi:hypothetical protein
MLLLNSNLLNIDIIKNSCVSYFQIIDKFSDTNDVDNFILSLVILNNTVPITNIGLMYENDGISMSFFHRNSSLYFNTLFNYFIKELSLKFPNIIIDIITCLVNNRNQIAVLKDLMKTNPVTIRYSTDLTGNLSKGGNWVQESNNVDIKSLYFNNTIDTYPNTLYNVYYTCTRKQPIFDISGNRIYLHTDISNHSLDKIYNDSGYNIRRYPGNLVAWGEDAGVSPVINNVRYVQTNTFGNAVAVSENHDITAWNEYEGDYIPLVDGSLNSIRNVGTIKGMYNNNGAFALIDNNGMVITWGEDWAGGDSTNVTNDISMNVAMVYSNDYAFTALKTSGTIVSWGSCSYGGDSAPTSSYPFVAVYSTSKAFAGLDSSGDVYAWGDYCNGGDIGCLDNTNILSVFSTSGAFAALKHNGDVVVWGDHSKGGIYDCSNYIYNMNIKTIFSNEKAFAALDINNNFIVWGNCNYGGTNNTGVDNTNIATIYSTKKAFAGLKKDGTVVLWGDSCKGGSNNTGVDLTNVKAIYSTEYAFAAHKNDNSVVVWGDSCHGGVISSGVYDISYNVVSIYSTIASFVAVLDNGDVISWGAPWAGGDVHVGGYVLDYNNWYYNDETVYDISGLLVSSNPSFIYSSNLAFMLISGPVQITINIGTPSAIVSYVDENGNLNLSLDGVHYTLAPNVRVNDILKYNSNMSSFVLSNYIFKRSMSQSS